MFSSSNIQIPFEENKVPDCSTVNQVLPDYSINYKGPFTNKTSLFVHTYKDSKSKGLNDQYPVPKQFSWYATAPTMIEDGTRNQGECNCCWAISTASALGDRYALKYGLVSPKPSATYLLSMTSLIDSSNNESPCCEGGSVSSAALFLTDSSNALKNEKCWPFENIAQVAKVSCEKSNKVYHSYTDLNNHQSCCWNCCGKNNIENKASFYIQKESVHGILDKLDSGDIDIPKTIYHIKLDILRNGPICTSIRVPTDFQDFWNNHANSPAIYYPSTNNSNGGHAMVITGWGTSKSGTDFWEVRNSWGPPGFLKIQMTSSNTPVPYRLGIDVPVYLDSNYNSVEANSIFDSPFGGCVSFLPGDISPDYDFKKAMNPAKTLPIQPPSDGYTDLNENKIKSFFGNLTRSQKYLIFSILIILVIIFLIILL